MAKTFVCSSDHDECSVMPGGCGYCIGVPCRWPMSQAESRLSRDIMDALRARGIFCFKVHGGPTMMAGLPDIIACVPIVWDATVHGDQLMGLFVGFETKIPGNNPTPVQAHVHVRITEAGGLVCVPHSVAEALAFVDRVSGTTDRF